MILEEVAEIVVLVGRDLVPGTTKDTLFFLGLLPEMALPSVSVLSSFFFPSPESEVGALQLLMGLLDPGVTSFFLDSEECESNSAFFSPPLGRCVGGVDAEVARGVFCPAMIFKLLLCLKYSLPSQRTRAQSPSHEEIVPRRTRLLPGSQKSTNCPVSGGHLVTGDNRIPGPRDEVLEEGLEAVGLEGRSIPSASWSK